jgi:hypothetical protein
MYLRTDALDFIGLEEQIRKVKNNYVNEYR